MNWPETATVVFSLVVLTTDEKLWYDQDENDYQIDVGTAAGMTEYKVRNAIID